MQIIDTCEANGGVCHSQSSLQTLWPPPWCPDQWHWSGLVLGQCGGDIYLFAVIQICIQLVNNTQWQLNGPVCTQNIEPTRALFGLNICSILSFLWTQRRPGETLWRVLTADSSNYLLLISAKRDERRKFIINNPSHEWHRAQITAEPAPGVGLQSLIRLLPFADLILSLQPVWPKTPRAAWEPNDSPDNFINDPISEPRNPQHIALVTPG